MTVPQTRPVLATRGLGKRFGAVRALHNIDLALEPGCVVGLVGDNGAGKSTLVGLIAGNYSPSEGELLLDGRPVHLAGPAAARAAGGEVVYQDLALCDNLSAAANLFLGRELRRRVCGVPVLDHAAMAQAAARVFEELDSDARPKALVRELSGGQRQAVAIGRAILERARIVLMDEPTASISVRQVSQVLDLIRRLRDQGAAVILVSHRMPDVFAVCDRVVVLRRGESVCDVRIETTSPEQVTGLITGAIQRV